MDSLSRDHETERLDAGSAKWCKVFFECKRRIREARLEPHQKHFLHVLMDYVRWNEWGFPTQKRLAADVGVTVTRIQQIIDELSILRVVEEREREQNRRYHEYRIDFTKLGTIQQQQQQQDKQHRQAKPASPVGMSSHTKPASHTHTKPASSSQTKPAWYRKNQGKAPRESSPSDDGDGWKEIQKQLRQEGVRAWREAVRCARENGCQPADIQPVIEHFRSHRDAWESPEGTLYHRVTNATPDQRPDDPETWLPMKPSFVRQTQSARDDERREVERQRRRLRSEADARSPPELEDEYGERLDEMTDAEVRELIQGYSSPGMLLDLVNANGRASDKARPLLLRLLYVQSHFTTHSKESMP